MPVQTSLRLRRGTAAQWTSANPVLSDGEPGVESDTGNIKVGDGTTAWSSLSYALSSRYVSKADEEYRWLGIGDLVPAFGSPSLVNPNLNTGNAPMWGLDATTAEGVAGSIILPDYWTNFKIELYWCNASSSSGDVRWLVIGGFGGSGEDPDAGPGEAIGGYRTLAAPTTGRLIEISQFPASTVNANQAGKIFTLIAYRDAAAAADTLANDAGVYGVLLTRTS